MKAIAKFVRAGPIEGRETVPDQNDTHRNRYKEMQSSDEQRSGGECDAKGEKQEAAGGHVRAPCGERGLGDCRTRGQGRLAESATGGANGGGSRGGFHP